MTVQLESSADFLDFVKAFDTRAIEEGEHKYRRLQDLLKAWIDTNGENNAVAATGNEWGAYMQAVVLIQNGYRCNPRLLDYEHEGVTYERDIIWDIDFEADEELGLPAAFDREYYMRRAFQLQQCSCPRGSMP